MLAAIHLHLGQWLVKVLLHLNMVLQVFRQLLNHHILVLHFALHLLNSHFEILLMNRVRCSLFHELLRDFSKTLALITVSLDLLLKFLGLGAFDILAENLELFVAFDHLIFEFSNLFLERHNKESFLLVFLSSLCKRHEVLVGVGLVLLALSDQLVVAE